MYCFPGEVLEVIFTYVSTVLEKMAWADVVLFTTSGKQRKYNSEWKFINESPVFVGVFNTDAWRSLNWPRFLRRDVVISTFFDFYRKREKSTNGMFWSPACAHIPNYDLPRDIDILTFGRIVGYPFREFELNQLRERCMGDPEHEPFYITHRVNVKGNLYTWVEVGHSALKRYCPRSMLVQLISRARFCVTSAQVYSARLGMPLGRYFEITAGGAVAISERFSDSDTLGFRHGETIWFTDETRFASDLAYLLGPFVEAEMSRNAKELIRSRHTPEIRAKELYTFLRSKTGKE